MFVIPAEYAILCNDLCIFSAREVKTQTEAQIAGTTN